MPEPSSQSSEPDISKRIAALELALGRLSPVQRMLLGTDGSVTGLLEVITGNPVEVKTLHQNVIPADSDMADELQIDLGDPVNHRIVALKDSHTGEVLIHAESFTPLKRLEPSFKDDLMRADIPIGAILKRHRIESRRDIMDAVCIPAHDRFSEVFPVFPKEMMLSRRYKIIRGGSPLISITETFPFNQFRDRRRVIVETPSRIHLTLTDLSGASGRVDGGIGIALDHPNVVLEGEVASDLAVEGEHAHRVEAAARAVMDRFGLPPARLTVRSAYKVHVGLGGGTQLAMAAGKALCELYGHQASTMEIASVVGRGGTSGIGTAAFVGGGFIVDGGHTFGPSGQKRDFRPSSASQGVDPPSVIARHDFPRHWEIVLAIPNISRGAHGRKEVDIFKEYCPVPLADVQELSRQILVRMMPSLVEEDLDVFGDAVNRIQGLGFKRVEVMLQHPLIHRLMEAMGEAGAACTGLSSFGPTVYAIGDSGIRNIEAAAKECMEPVGGDLMITRCRNWGARVRTT